MIGKAPLDRPFLESLTTAELIKLADREGIDLPPGLERILIIGELLDTLDDVEEEEEKDHGPFPKEKRLPASSAPFPGRYNITYLNVLVRDPLWAFAFWEINDHDREIHEKAPDFGGYCLRVEEDPRPGDAGPAGPRAGKDLSFVVQVGIEDSAWYLGFSPPGGAFRVELCATRREEPVILAVSAPFTLPNLHEPLGNRYSPASHNPLLRLSGIDEFRILHNTSRLSRLPKHSVAEKAGTVFKAGDTGSRE
jgi:hypothetical protein